MEEEYAFKAAISTSFEGYRRQMAEVASGLDPDSPLARLCTDTLRTIATPPALVYDKQRLDPSPGSIAAELMEPLKNTVQRAIRESVPLRQNDLDAE
jgi:hypothetical protein